MNTLGILGTVVGSVVLIGGAVYTLKKYFASEDVSKKLLQYLSASRYKNVVEVEELSLRTYGAWMKTLNLPNYDNYHFFVIKVPISKLPEKYSDKKDVFGDFAYAFVLTNDIISQIISFQITVSQMLDAKFEEKIIQEVTEIKL